MLGMGHWGATYKATVTYPGLSETVFAVKLLAIVGQEDKLKPFNVAAQTD